jgi:nitrilase
VNSIQPRTQFLQIEGETILLAEIDRAAIARGKFDFDAVGHYARPDVFSLHVDERRKSPVVTLTDADAPEPIRGSLRDAA